MSGPPTASQTMASARSRKSHSTLSADEAIPAFPAPPTSAKTVGRSQRTPEHSPAKRTAGITHAQKQAIVDNLQLEITERARKLRAQYALQAQALRSRLEMRVNRIPAALRKRNMQDLVDEHTEKAKPLPPPPVPVALKMQTMQALERVPAKQNAKRKSDDISAGDDKENMPSQSAQDLANPKKRAKTGAATANSKATRTASRKVGPGGVLSPKSHNSRNLPRSPLKPSYMSPEKAPPARLAHAAQATTSKAASSRPPSRQVKKAIAVIEKDSRNSEASTTSSAGTTIVTKPGTKRTAAAAKKAITAKPAAASVSRAGAARKETTATGSGRTLRKRT